MTMYRTGTTTALIAFLVVACGQPGRHQAAGWQAIVDTTGDTVTIRTVSGSAWGGTAILEAEVGIGTVEGADEYILGNPSSLAVAADGTIYVLDAQVPIIRAYGPDGTFEFNVGRKGGGPGEYDYADAIAVLPDGRLIVKDPGNTRISVFSSRGEFITTWPHPSPGFNTDRRYYVDTLGNSYPMALRERGLPPWEWRYLLVRTSPNGAILDSLLAPTWDYQPPQLTASRPASSAGGPSASSRAVPFSPGSAWTFSPLGYFVGGLSTEYRIDLYRRNAPVLRIERVWTPVPVSEEERDGEEHRISVNMRRQYPGWRWNGPPIPETKPPFTGMFADADGRIWVILSQPGVPTMTAEEARETETRTGRAPMRFRQPLAFDVFASDGSYLGRVDAPATLRSEPEPVVIGDQMWAVTRDELDVATVVRFHIVLPLG